MRACPVWELIEEEGLSTRENHRGSSQHGALKTVVAIASARARLCSLLVAGRTEMAMAVAIDGFDKADQAARVASMLIEGEVLYAVYDCKGRGTGFIGITDRRIIARDDGHLKHSKHIVSIPYSQISAVGLGSEYHFAKSNEGILTIHTGSGEDWEFHFRGDGKTTKAYQRVMQHVAKSSGVPTSFPEVGNG